MTIEEYKALTGLSVADSDEQRIKAIIKRSEAKLGTLLGYSLRKNKNWTELGRMQYDGLVPFPSLPVSDEVKASLLPPTKTSGDVRLFNFSELDKHIRIQPAKQVYSAKIVLPVSNDEFITIYDLDNGVPYLNTAGLVVAITRFVTWYTWTWWNSLLFSNKMSLMIAIDGDFVDICDVNKYEDLAYLLADMVSYYSDENYSLMGNIRSESIDSHSYSRASTGATPDEAAPEGQATGKLVIAKYAGPAAYRNLVQ